MTDLVKLIHTQQEDEEDILVTDRHIVLDRTVHLYGEAAFKNCSFEIAPHGSSRFVLEEDASVTFENCSFVGSLTRSANGSSTHRAVISGEEDSSLAFMNCRIENADSFISSDGEVTLHGCEIVYHGAAAVGDEAYKPTGRTSFLSSLSEAMKDANCGTGLAVKKTGGALACRFLWAEGEEVELTNCTLDCETNGDYFVKLSMEHGRLSNCTLKGMSEIVADEIHNCTVENCAAINLQTEDGNNEATGCRFVNCGKILATNADFSDCEISGLYDRFESDETTVTRCTFCDLTEGSIDIENTQMDGCTFENITRKKNCFLINADNESSLDNCTFRKCRTTRDDLQLVGTGAYEGRFSKKWVEEDICYNCTGLDKVIHLESWEV